MAINRADISCQLDLSKSLTPRTRALSGVFGSCIVLAVGLAATFLFIGSSEVLAQSGLGFGGGLQLLGTNIASGRYVATNTDGCYWERLSGLSGETADIIANDFVGDAEQVVVDIAASDVGFDSSNCSPWAPISEVGLGPVSSFGTGT